MDSTGITQFLLVILTLTAVAGFAGITYYLAEICRALNGREPERPPEVTGARGEPATARPAPPLKRIDPRTAVNLEETLGAIGEKYGLASFTLATADGLLLGSTKPGSEDEAARCSYLYTQGRLHDEPGAELLGIPHRGETVVGIVRAPEPLSAERTEALEQDVRDTLHYWV